MSEYKSIDPAGLVPGPGEWAGWILSSGAWLCVISSRDIGEVKMILKHEANRRRVQHRHRWCLPAGKTPATRDD